MNQTLDARLEFDKRAEIREARDGAVHAFAGLIFFGDRVPRMRLKLLHADRNALLVRVDLDDHGFDLLARGKHVRRLVDATPRNFADMQQGIHAADIDERAVIGQAAHFALHGIALLQFARSGAACRRVSSSSAMTRRSTTTSSSSTSSLMMRQRISCSTSFSISDGVARSAARSGHEGAHSDVDAQAALDHARHGADDRRLLGKSFLQRRPVGGTLDFAARQFVVAFRIAALDGDLHFVAGLRRLVRAETR